MDALQPLFAVAWTAGGVAVTWLEAAAFVLAVAMVVCNIRVDPLAWPLAIVSSLLYFALFWNSRLYGDALLQVMFVAIAGWGWRQWIRGTAPDGGMLRVTRLGPGRTRRMLVAALAVAWPATALLLRYSTDTDVPWWDAFPTAASVVNQWLVGRKHVESWLVWIVVNAVATTLFAYKGLALTALLYAVFVAMSVVGYRAWARLADADAVPRPFVVALVGAESTGKTQLAEALHERLAAAGRTVVVVGEYLREFCDARGRTPRQDEQAAIAAEQTRRIDAACAARPDVVIADTTALMTAVYSDAVFGDRSLYPGAQADHARRCDLTLLAAPDLPWRADGIQRTGRHVQGPVDALIRAALGRAGVAFVAVEGSGDARTDAARAALDSVIP